jgi:Na+-transporting NADH:ubiquinone oxidoreductase subunit NqrC
MLKKTLTVSALTGVLVFGTGLALADDQDRTRLQDRDQTKSKVQDQDRIFGSQLMTKQERNEYRNRMRSAKTPQEREQIRAEHHERMQARAKERGVTLPDNPPPRGGSFRQGGGMAPGGGKR